MITAGQLNALRLLEHISVGEFRFVYLSNHDYILLRVAMWFHWFGQKVHSGEASIKGLKTAMHSHFRPQGSTAREVNDDFKRIALKAISDGINTGLIDCWHKANRRASEEHEPEIRFEDALELWRRENLLTSLVRQMGLRQEEDDAFTHGWEVANIHDLSVRETPAAIAEAQGRGTYRNHRAYFIGGYICGCADRSIPTR